MKTTDLQKEIFDKVALILSKMLKIQKAMIKPESKLADDLGIDSVDFFEIVVRLNEDFQIKITEEEIPRLEFVSDIVAFLEKKIAMLRIPRR